MSRHPPVPEHPFVADLVKRGATMAAYIGRVKDWWARVVLPAQAASLQWRMAWDEALPVVAASLGAPSGPDRDRLAAEAAERLAEVADALRELEAVHAAGRAWRAAPDGHEAAADLTHALWCWSEAGPPLSERFEDHDRLPDPARASLALVWHAMHAPASLAGFIASTLAGSDPGSVLAWVGLARFALDWWPAFDAGDRPNEVLVTRPPGDPTDVRVFLWAVGGMRDHLSLIGNTETVPPSDPGPGYGSAGGGTERNDPTPPIVGPLVPSQESAAEYGERGGALSSQPQLPSSTPPPGPARDDLRPDQFVFAGEVVGEFPIKQLRLLRLLGQAGRGGLPLPDVCQALGYAPGPRGRKSLESLQNRAQGRLDQSGGYLLIETVNGRMCLISTRGGG